MQGRPAGLSLSSSPSASPLVGAYIAWQRLGSGSQRARSSPRASLPIGGRSLIIAAGLLIHLNILKPFGFVISAVFLFLCVAFAFGSRRFLRDGVVGVIWCSSAYLGFTHGLGLQLPPGIFAGLL